MLKGAIESYLHTVVPSHPLCSSNVTNRAVLNSLRISEMQIWCAVFLLDLKVTRLCPHNNLTHAFPTDNWSLKLDCHPWPPSDLWADISWEKCRQRISFTSIYLLTQKSDSSFMNHGWKRRAEVSITVHAREKWQPKIFLSGTTRASHHIRDVQKDLKHPVKRRGDNELHCAILQCEAKYDILKWTRKRIFQSKSAPDVSAV